MMNLELLSQTLANHKNPTRKSISAIGKPHPKNKFTEEEDFKLRKIVEIYGDKDWELISRLMETRNPRQCRERYTNYLNPSINNDPWSEDEDRLLIEKFNQLGGKWVKISKFFENRTDSQLKNRWQVLKRKEKTLHQLNNSPVINLCSQSQNSLLTIEGNHSYESPRVSDQLEEKIADQPDKFEPDVISNQLIESFAPLDMFDDNNWLFNF